jgi:hypothetical protein
VNRVGVAFLLIGLCATVWGAEDTIAPNAIYGEGGWAFWVAAGHLSYERSLLSPQDTSSIDVRLRIGAGVAGNSEDDWGAGAWLLLLTGRNRRHHVELGGGFGLGEWTSLADGNRFVYGVGYRYQRPGNVAGIFRAGLNNMSIWHVSVGLGF